MFVGTAQGHRADAQYMLSEQTESEWVMYFNCQVFNFRLPMETHVDTGDICMRGVRDQASELSGGAAEVPGCPVCPSKESQVGEQAGRRGRGQSAWRQQPAGPEAAPLGEGTEQRKDTLDLGCNGIFGAGSGDGRPAGVSGACGEGILRRE